MTDTIHSFHSDRARRLTGTIPNPRKLEILNIARRLRLDAQNRGVTVNSSYLAVHEVLAEAFAADPALTVSSDLYALMSSRLQFHLAATGGLAA